MEGACSWLLSSDCLQHVADHMERLYSSWQIELVAELKMLDAQSAHVWALASSTIQLCKQLNLSL